jgi:hypothetical protein
MADFSKTKTTEGTEITEMCELIAALSFTNSGEDDIQSWQESGDEDQSISSEWSPISIHLANNEENTLDFNDKVKDLLAQFEVQCHQNQKLASKNQELILKRDALQQTEIELHRKHESEREHNKNQLSRLEIDHISSGQCISSLEVENNYLRRTTQYAQLKREVAQLTDDLWRLQMAYDMLHSDKSQLEGDLDGLCDILQAMQQQHEQDFLNAIARERARGIRLEFPVIFLQNPRGQHKNEF